MLMILLQSVPGTIRSHRKSERFRMTLIFKANCKRTDTRKFAKVRRTDGRNTGPPVIARALLKLFFFPKIIFWSSQSFDYGRTDPTLSKLILREIIFCGRNQRRGNKNCNLFFSTTIQNKKLFFSKKILSRKRKSCETHFSEPPKYQDPISCST
jgi:hypothetical protein